MTEDTLRGRRRWWKVELQTFSCTRRHVKTTYNQRGQSAACYHLFHSATTKPPLSPPPPPLSSFTAAFNFCFKFSQKTIWNLVACPAVHSVRCCWREQKEAEPTPCMQPGSWCHWSFPNGSVGARKWNNGFSLFLEFVFLTGGSQAEDEELVSQGKNPADLDAGSHRDESDSSHTVCGCRWESLLLPRSHSWRRELRSAG